MLATFPIINNYFKIGFHFIIIPRFLKKTLYGHFRVSFIDKTFINRC